MQQAFVPLSSPAAHSEMIHKRNFKYTKFTPYSSMERCEAKVIEKNKNHNPGAYRLVRKEGRIGKGPEPIFQKMTFLI